MSVDPEGEPQQRVVALSGGIGGAKLVLGLSRVLDPSALVIVANTGDDFEHLGLTICPDIDTLTYTLAGLSDLETGWGRAGETWSFMAALEAVGGETWFELGDSDLALHVERTRRLAAGDRLSAIIGDVCARLGVEHRIVPASEDPVRTVAETTDGPMAFQHYFVREGCRPKITGFHFEGAADARPHPALIEALASGETGTVVICPSNPFISIDPILAVAGVRAALEGCTAPVIAVSPIVGGDAVKGPTAKIMGELGLEVSAAAVAGHYGSLIDGFVLDTRDAGLAATVRRVGPQVSVTDTVMNSDEDKVALARHILDFARALGADTG